MNVASGPLTWGKALFKAIVAERYRMHAGALQHHREVDGCFPTLERLLSGGCLTPEPARLLATCRGDYVNAIHQGDSTLLQWWYMLNLWWTSAFLAWL